MNSVWSSAPVLKGRKRKRKLAVKNGDLDETVESETGSGSVTTSSDLASPAKVTVHCLIIMLNRNVKSV